MGSRKRQKLNLKEEKALKAGPESSQAPEKGQENLGAPAPAITGDEVTDPDASESAGKANTVGTRSRSTEDGQMLIRPVSAEKALVWGDLAPYPQNCACHSSCKREHRCCD